MLLQEIKPKQEVSLYSLQRRERNTRLMFEPHLFSSAEKPCRGLPWGIYLLYFSATGFGKKKDFQIPFWSLHEAGKDSDSRDIWPGAGNAILLLSTTDCKRSCKQPHSSSWRASQGLGNHKIQERKYTKKKKPFPSTTLRRLSLIMHRGKQPNIPSQIWEKPHKLIIVWPSQRQIWILHIGHLTKPQNEEGSCDLTAQLSDLQQRALLCILPLISMQDSSWVLQKPTQKRLSRLFYPAPIIDTIFTSEGKTGLKKADIFPRDILYWPLEKNVATKF